MLQALIPAGVSLLGSYLASQQDAPSYGLSSADINKIIDAKRTEGEQRIKQLGMQAKSDVSARLAASGLTPSIGLQQAAYNPILERLGGASALLQGQLAGTEAQLRLGQASGQQAADLASYNNLMNLLSGIVDLGGVGALYGMQNQPQVNNAGYKVGQPTGDPYSTI